MKKIIFFSFLFLFSYNLLQASDSLNLIKHLPLNARLISTDALGNIYVVKNDNTLLRFNSLGDSLGIFNEIKKGKITQLDVTNPLRILLFFADYAQIVILDNMLSQKATLKLNTIGLSQVSCIANSQDGEIWVYSSAMASLLKLNDQLEISLNANQRHLSDKSIEPTYMIENDRNLYLVDSVAGIFKFDPYALYNTTYHFNTTTIQLFKEYAVYYESPFLVSYNLQSFTEKRLSIPNATDVLQVRLERNRIVVLRKNYLDIYNWINN